MAAFASTDITVTVTQVRKVNGSPTRRHNKCTITFGAGTETYATGGVPMPAGGSFGMPNGVVEAMQMDDDSAGAGYHYTYDQTNNKLLGWFSATGATDVQISNGTNVAASTIKATVIGY